MSTKKSKKKHSKKQTIGCRDVTINDFANSAITSTRLKKSNILQKLKDEKSWDEKDDDELDGDFTEIENDDGTISYELQKRSPKLKPADQTLSSAGNDYPIDVWFLISEYIRPEDVGRFAAICRTSYQVTRTAKFWFNLYRRYKPDAQLTLPKELQPLNIMRKFGLKTSVIRALHFYYPFFRKPILSQKHPEVLKRMQCVSMWYNKFSVPKHDYISYYFKMQRASKPKAKQSILEIFDDIGANQEENYRVLWVKCKSLRGLPSVLGLTLTSACLTLSQGLIDQRLQLVFASGIYQSTSLDGDASIRIVLDPVIDVTVLDWWHPRYPHCNNVEHLLNQE